MRSFGSDNYSGVHPKVMEAIARANQDHAPAYGNDPITQRVTEMLKSIFGKDSEPFFVLTGTAANILAITSLVNSFNSVICASFSHVSFDESTGPETFTGCKFIPIESDDAKLTVESVTPHLERIGNPHAAQPKVISITQPNEYGILYSAEEIRALADLAHRYGLYLHVDGSRFANACASLGVGLAEGSKELGVDVLSLGGTKNGLLCGEVVIFFSKDLAASTQYFRKSLAQLASKMRFVTAQFEAYLTDELWLENAGHANQMAKLLSDGLKKIDGFTLSRPTDVNMVYGRLSNDLLKRLQKDHLFYVANTKTNEARFVTSFDTTEADVDLFIKNAIG